MAKKDSSGTFHLSFQGRLTVDRASVIKKAFQDALAGGKTQPGPGSRGDPIVVDVNGAVEIDITFFQLLFAAHKAALAAGRKFSLAAEHPPVMRKALGEAGLCTHAGLCANTPVQCLWTGGGTP